MPVARSATASHRGAHPSPAAPARFRLPAATPDGRRQNVSPHTTFFPRTTSSPQLLDVACPDRTHWLELPAQRSSVRVARRSVHARLTAWRVPGELSADAVLILSELAANAVCHTASARILCGIGLTAADRLRMEVHDHEFLIDTLPRCEAALDDERGRGLFLVQELACAWGVDRSRLTGGNSVWATMRVPAARDA
jgi:anti-sigma regulatory factor (Ser/Thr protein kinase)